MENSRRSALTVVLNTFFICIVAYFVEYKFFYTRSVAMFGTAIFSKFFGIAAIIIAIFLLKSNWKCIGYVVKLKKIISGVLTPVIILGICAVASFFIIKLLVESQGGNIEISFKIGLSSLEPQGATSPSYISFIIAIFSAIVSAFMIETLLRGLVLQTANEHLRFYASNTIAVVLTIIWHNIIYVFNFAFGSMTTTSFIRSIICSTVIYGAAAIRRSLYTRASGAIWGCLIDYFLSIMIIGNLPITVNLPYEFYPTNLVAYLVSFMSSRLNNSYATIAFMGLVSVLSLVIMMIYCSILKKRARKKYIKRISESNATENN